MLHLKEKNNELLYPYPMKGEELYNYFLALCIHSNMMVIRILKETDHSIALSTIVRPTLK